MPAVAHNRNDDPAAFLYLSVMLDPRRMQLLREVAERGSFSAAARSLHLTQPAVSRAVAKLEREAGTRLLERTSRGIRLTEAGELVVARAAAIAGHLAAVERDLEAVRGLRAGSVRVGAFPHGGASLVVPAAASLAQEHPDVEVAFRDVSSAAGLRLVAAGELDVAVVFRGRGDPPPTDGLVRTHLLDDPMLVALPASHRLAGKRSIALAELRDERWIHGTQHAVSGLILRACRDAGFEPRVVAQTDHAAISHGLVAAGVGVTLVPGLALPTLRPDVVARPVRGGGPVRVVEAVALDERPRPPATEAMLEALVRAARR
jgi:molybdate transport repressor ModE-like protein